MITTAVDLRASAFGVLFQCACGDWSRKFSIEFMLSCRVAQQALGCTQYLGPRPYSLKGFWLMHPALSFQDVGDSTLLGF